MKKNNEKFLISLRREVLLAILIFTGGVFFAAALPPLNLSFLSYIAVVPLLYFAVDVGYKRAFLYGWIWGIGWAVFSFQFLREIDPVIPYLMAPVKALWFALFASFLPLLWKYCVFPFETIKGGFEKRKELLKNGIPIFRQIIFASGTTSLYILVDATHSHLLPWNGIEVTAWQNLPLLQISSIAGQYSIAFIIVFINVGVFMLIKSYRRSIILLLGLVIFSIVMLWGMAKINVFNTTKNSNENIPWKATLIQGDISQRRNANYNLAIEALDIYDELTREAIKKYPNSDIIIWPESAVPMSYRSRGELGEKFRSRVTSLLDLTDKKMLIGALDYILLDQVKREYGSSNSALLLSKGGIIEQKYDKIHRVPFGEYVPFRNLLPQFVIDHIGMGRDLTAGTNFDPMVLDNNINLGVAICFEGIFSYVNREFAKRNANVLLVISNDAWYPESSEPEQHLANAVIRAVETGLYMVRCGNNGGTLVVSPTGKIEQILEVDGTGELHTRRGRGITQITLNIPENPPKTFFVKHGQWFILLTGMFFIINLIISIQNLFKMKIYLYNAVKESAENE